jgi:hypothetical protein
MKAYILIATLGFFTTVNAYSAQITFNNLNFIRKLHHADQVMSHGKAVSRYKLGSFQSNCKPFDFGYTDFNEPVKAGFPYKMEIGSDRSSTGMRNFKVLAIADSNWNAGFVRCFVYEDVNQSIGEILKKHLGDLVQVTE